ncbi:MAG: stage IV sporulation protein A [Ruminococcaceae bacterium]|nr:stage IV sporulation protein A [Oscillospiraceae bacterium]
MQEYAIYRDIAARTMGNIYIGVVGPVRTGKSTFIKRFMETMVIPAIDQEADRTRAQDELPQSAGGKTVMTTEPKFIPDEAVTVTVADPAAGQSPTSLRIRMIDCVGYLIPGAVGGTENDAPRMVHTPWSSAPLPFEEAAEIGTHKVIAEHATIGILVTTDGSIGELPRDAYISAEERVVRELTDQNKPFVIVLNSAHPGHPDTVALGLHLEETYHAPVALLSCMDMDNEDIRHILALALEQFPIRELRISMPDWMCTLPADHRVTHAVFDAVNAVAAHIRKMGDAPAALAAPGEQDDLERIEAVGTDPGSGSITLALIPKADLFYRIIGEETGFTVDSDAALLTLLTDLAKTKKAYDRVSGALEQVRTQGWGTVMPDISEFTLEEPEIVRQNSSYGVRLRASAPSIHMIRANIEAQVAPIVGTEQQSEEMVRFLMHEFEEDPARLWQTNMFGKSLHELVGEGLHAKLAHMPDDARQKLGETVERIINEGAGGLVCILL